MPFLSILPHFISYYYKAYTQKVNVFASFAEVPNKKSGRALPSRL
jgi:hypothetical protein